MDSKDEVTGVAERLISSCLRELREDISTPQASRKGIIFYGEGTEDRARDLVKPLIAEFQKHNPRLNIKCMVEKGGIEIRVAR